MKTMKTIMIMLLTVLLVASLCACGSSGDSDKNLEILQETADVIEGETQEEETNIPVEEQERKIVYISRDLSDMYASFLVQVFEKTMNEKYPGWTMEVLDLAGDYAANPDFIANATTMGADAVIGQFQDVSPVDAAIEAGEKGVAVICFDQPFLEETGKIAMVYCDDYKMGQQIGELAAELIPENGRYGIISITETHTGGINRTKGIVETLEGQRSDLEYIGVQDAQIDKNNAIRIATDWYTQYGQLDAILTNSDTCALGAIEAYRSLGLDLSKTVFIGLDGGSDAVAAILEGELAGSVLQSAEDFALQTFSIAADVFSGKLDPTDHENQPCIAMDTVMITAENIEHYYELCKTYGIME